MTENSRLCDRRNHAWRKLWNTIRTSENSKMAITRHKYTKLSVLFDEDLFFFGWGARQADIQT